MVTVKKICADKQTVDTINGIKYLTEPSNVWVEYLHNGERHTIVFRFMEGFACDGLSVPKIFQKWLPKWDNNNEKYNAAGMIHDWLYITKGIYGHFTRSECDDFLRGIMREANKTRFWASAADWAVGCFAGGKSHWGNDDYDSKFLCLVEMDP